jgi:hypothetical protein
MSVADELDGLRAEWFIYGGAATILSGIDIGTTSDIDILTTSAGTGELRTALKTIHGDKSEDERGRPVPFGFRPVPSAR